MSLIWSFPLSDTVNTTTSCLPQLLSCTIELLHYGQTHYLLKVETKLCHVFFKTFIRRGMKFKLTVPAPCPSLATYMPLCCSSHSALQLHSPSSSLNTWCSRLFLKRPSDSLTIAFPLLHSVSVQIISFRRGLSWPQSLIQPPLLQSLFVPLSYFLFFMTL